jgi:hypothetical protein
MGRIEGRSTVAMAEGGEETFEVGDEVIGGFRCAECDLLIRSPSENDGIMVLPTCSLCGSETWRRVA